MFFLSRRIWILCRWTPPLLYSVGMRTTARVTVQAKSLTIGDMGPNKGLIRAKEGGKSLRSESAIGELDFWHGHRKGRFTLLYRRHGRLVDRLGQHGCAEPVWMGEGGLV